ncbi:hypothetical protein FACS1894102_5070 [Spirochaetia bacterium]|nr:hypothetical protein FACS1894102_5070 [Spirochaetia bacterium]
MLASINGTRIFFDVDGKQFVPDYELGKMKEKPVCFVLHGGPGSDHSCFLPALNPLSAYMQLIYIDYRGNGRSDYPHEDTYTITQNISDIESLRLYLGLEKIVLLGHSYGGMMALSYACEHTEHVQGMILLATACNYKFLERAKAKLNEIGTKEQIEMANRYLWSGKMPDNTAYKEFFRLFAGLYSVKAAKRLQNEANLNTSDANSQNNSASTRHKSDVEILSYKALNKAFSGDLQKYDYSSRLGKIKCPVLAVGAENDWITPLECTHEIAAGLPNCTTVIIENCGHSLLVDQGDKVVNSIIDFVKTIVETMKGDSQKQVGGTAPLPTAPSTGLPAPPARMCSAQDTSDDSSLTWIETGRSTLLKTPVFTVLEISANSPLICDGKNNGITEDGGKSERLDKSDKSERSDESDKSERSGKSNKSEKSDKSQKSIAGKFNVIDASPWAVVIPVLECDGRKYFVMVEQWRHGSKTLSIEFPGGVIEEGEDPVYGAARELREETGYKAARLESLGTMSPNPAIMSNELHLFLASGLVKDGSQILDSSEFVNVHYIEAGEVIRNMGKPPYIHALMASALGLYLARDYEA